MKKKVVLGSKNSLAYFVRDLLMKCCGIVMGKHSSFFVKESIMMKKYSIGP